MCMFLNTNIWTLRFLGWDGKYFWMLQKVRGFIQVLDIPEKVNFWVFWNKVPRKNFQKKKTVSDSRHFEKEVKVFGNLGISRDKYFDK